MPEDETIALIEEFSAIIQHKLPLKLKDLVSFTVPCSMENSHDLNSLIDSRSSINLMPLSIYRKLRLDDRKATSIILQLANRTLKHPYGVIEDMLIKVGNNFFLADFIIHDIDAQHIPLILERMFLTIA
ncbi:uncharacterized protein LOC111392825 [Olea europaea var. sylvestris]|uniref:uncharacterized protein LOC111392825 n=1 Tax=Olea europaea var. sylvestris TaxID=158386 RepID=UPI000C1D35F1|nr:uncharacterized protein LOC111392825 [Olea europaea var. sylvestris]